MTRYAQKTEVPVERSRAEIESILTRYGADQFGYAHDTGRGLASIQFRAADRHIKFVLRLPNVNADEFRYTPARRKVRGPDERHKAWEQACRQRWRALALCIKAKLEAVEAEITEFENEFMAHIVLPNGRTVAELMRPQIAEAYLTGDMPSGVAGFIGVQEGDDAV